MDTDKDFYRPGLFNVRYYKAAHKAPDLEMKDDQDVRVFLRYMAYHLFECHENPVQKLIEKMIRIKKGKRDFKKDGFVSKPSEILVATPTEPPVPGADNELDYRTDNDSSYLVDNQKNGPVGTPIIYISKSRPEGKIAEIDNLRGSSIGGEVHRGNAWRVLLKAFVWNEITEASANLHECLTIEPPGWDFDAPLDMIHVGNVISQQLYQRLSTDIFHGMLAYADIKAISHAASTKLACFGLLCKLRSNPLLPNKAYLATLVFDTMALPKLRFVEEAQVQFLDLRYADDVWADEYIRALILHQDEMQKADEIVTDDSLFQKFWIDVTRAHRIVQPGADFYSHKLYELVKIHSYIQANPKKTNHIDPELLNAVSSLDALHTYLISVRTNAQTYGITRKVAPLHWSRTPVSDERIKDIRSRLQVHKSELEEQETSEELLVMTQKQRNDKYKNKAKQYHNDYTNSKQSTMDKQRFVSRMQRDRKPPPKIPDGGYWNPNPKSSNPFENSSRAWRPPPKKPQAPPVREPFGTNFPKRHSNVLAIIDEQLERLDPNSTEAALARRMLQEMQAMKIESSPGSQQDNNDYAPYKDHHQERPQTHYSREPTPQSYYQPDQQFDQDTHEANQIYDGICRDYSDPDERAAILNAYLEYRDSQHECKMLGGDFQSIEYEPTQLYSHSLYQAITHDTAPINLIRALVDTGCSICCNPAKKRPPIPGTCYKLKVPLRLHQGKGFMDFHYLGCIARVVETPDMNYVITTLAVMTNFDNDADIISATSLSTLGLGTCMTPCHPITKRKLENDYLHNHNERVRIPLEPKVNGLPYIKCSLDFNRDKPFIDAFTGNEYDLKPACERAMAAFSYYFVGANAGIPFDPPADFDFGLNTLSIEEYTIERPLFPRIGGLEYHSSDNQTDSMFQVYANQQLAMNEQLRSEHLAMTETREPGTSVLDTPFVPPSDFHQASPAEQDLTPGL